MHNISFSNFSCMLLNPPKISNDTHSQVLASPHSKSLPCPIVGAQQKCLHPLRCGLRRGSTCCLGIAKLLATHQYTISVFGNFCPVNWWTLEILDDFDIYACWSFHMLKQLFCMISIKLDWILEKNLHYAVVVRKFVALFKEPQAGKIDTYTRSSTLHAWLEWIIWWIL